MRYIIKLSVFVLYCFAAEAEYGASDCVNPGLQNEISSVNIEIPVRKDNDNLKMHWVNTRETVSKGNGKVTFTVDGLIDFCPEVESKTLVPALFCDDDSEPDYSEAENIDNVSDDFGRDLGKVCSGGSTKSRKRYVDTGIKVNAGDKLIFSLVPRTKTIICDNAKNFADQITLDEIYSSDNGDVTDPVAICRGSDKFFCPGQETKSVKQPLFNLPGKYDVLIGNGYTPYDNKVYRNGNLPDPWMKSALLDLRRCPRQRLMQSGELFPLGQAVRDEIFTSCSADQECIKRKEIEYAEKEKRKYGLYELNCTGNKICYNARGIGTDCVSSIRYKKYDRNNRCDMYSYLEDNIEDNIKDEKGNILRKIKIWGNVENNNENNQCNIASGIEEIDDNISWAESLVAKIVSPSKERVGANNIIIDSFPLPQLLDDSEGSQCFPNKNNESDKKCALINSDDFKQSSLQLDHEYTVSNVKDHSSVMLAIAGIQGDDYNLYKGGYHVKTRKSCKFARGEKLYLYIGNRPPEDIDQIFQGDANMFYHLDPSVEHDSEIVSKKQEGCNVVYTINKEKLKDDETKKIYFGIDVRNAISNELAKNNSIYNRYNVNLSVKNRMNNWVSSTVNGVLNYVKKHVIQKSDIKDVYKKYAKRLLNSVSALLTLYIIFSAMGYILGTIELGINDFIIRKVKIAFIIFALSERSWEFFGENLYTIFIDATSDLIDSFSGYNNPENTQKFAFLDKSLGVLFSVETWLKFFSLAITGPFGFIAFVSILWATVIFLKCMIIAIMRYLIATVLVGLLLTLGPLFIILFLFQITRDLFHSWIRMMASVSMQPVIAFTFLSLLNGLLYNIFYNITNFSACYDCLFSLNLGGYDTCIIKAIWPVEYDPNTSVDAALNTQVKSGGHFASLPIDIIQALIYFILANVIDQFIQVSGTITETIFSSWVGIQSISKISSSASQALLFPVGLDRETQQYIAEVKNKEPEDSTGQSKPSIRLRSGVSNRP